MSLCARLLSIVAIMSVAMTACDGRHGYLDDSQQIVIDRLTGCHWRMTFMHVAGFEPIEYRTEGYLYRFNSDGTGWSKWIDRENPEAETSVRYFRWAFTNPNFAVICISGDIPEYWLIEALTPSSLHVKSSFADPVVYPDRYATDMRFVAER